MMSARFGLKSIGGSNTGTRFTSNSLFAIALMVASVVGLAADGTSAALTDNLLGYYQFEADGSDSSGNSRDTSLMGTAAISPGGLFGNALDLTTNPESGGTNAWAERSHDPAFNFGTSDFTVQAWINLPFEIPADEIVFVEQFTGASGPGWTFYWARERLEFYDGQGFAATGPASITPPNVWHQVAVRRSSGTILEFFYDGASMGTGISTTDIFSFGNFYIGRRNTGQSESLIGLMDEVALWNRALSDQEVGDLYNSGQGLLIIGPTNVPGDFDGDGDVDGADFVAWQTHFPTASGATLADGDADGDGDVDGADFVVWQTNFPFTPASGVAPVPEPASKILFMLGAIVALVRWRIRR